MYAKLYSNKKSKKAAIIISIFANISYSRESIVKLVAY